MQCRRRLPNGRVTMPRLLGGKDKSFVAVVVEAVVPTAGFLQALGTRASTSVGRSTSMGEVLPDMTFTIEERR